MPKKSWNQLVKNYPSRIILGAAVSASLPTNVQFDKAEQKLPSPYGLFIEWVKDNLKGDWSSMKVPGGFCIAVSDQRDLDLIKRTFGFYGDPVETPASKKTQQIGYSDQKYTSLAKALGYAV
jgi:hypothetical protein